MCLEDRAANEKHARARDHLFDMLVAPDPFFNAEIGGLDGMRASIEPQRLDDERVSGDTRKPSGRRASIPSKLEEVVRADEHVLILFLFRLDGQACNYRCELFPCPSRIRQEMSLRESRCW